MFLLARRIVANAADPFGRVPSIATAVARKSSEVVFSSASTLSAA